MTINYELKSKPYGEIMISILEDQGIMELLNGDISGYFRAYRSTSPEIFSNFFKQVFLIDPRVAAIISEDKKKEEFTAISMTDAVYIVKSITGMCDQTTKRRIDECRGILTLPGKSARSKMVRPVFTDDELLQMKEQIAQAKINININTIGEYDGDDVQVVTNEIYNNQISD